MNTKTHFCSKTRSSVPTMTSPDSGSSKELWSQNGLRKQSHEFVAVLLAPGVYLVSKARLLNSLALQQVSEPSVCPYRTKCSLHPSNTDSHQNDPISSLEQGRKCLPLTLLAGECGLILGGELITE